MTRRDSALPYDEALARKVLDRIAGGELLRDLWRDPDLPTRGDLRRWRHADPAFETRVRDAVNAARSRWMTTYDPDVAEAICLGLVEGRSLKAVCAGAGMPSVVTVFEWLKTQPDFAHAMGVAREVQGDRLAADAWEIAQTITPENARAVSVQLAQARWQIGKLSPKKYGALKPRALSRGQGGAVTHVYIKRFIDAADEARGSGER